jgi:molecular chaperone GrpE
MNVNDKGLREEDLKNNQEVDETSDEKVTEESSVDNGNVESKAQNEEELKTKDEEINNLKNKLLRLQADFVNYKKRAEKEMESSIDYGIESIVSDLLPIIDNFQRAIDSEVDKENNFYKGVSLIAQQLFDLLKKNSVLEIDCLGKPFDPNFHHAVFMEESNEYESGVVIEVLQKGYMIKDKVIRPSMVKVSK